LATKKSFFYDKVFLQDPDPDLFVRSRFRSADPDPDPDPLQNVMDPQHWFQDTEIFIRGVQKKHIKREVMYSHLGLALSVELC
jgi:hypothetical protein